MKRYSLILMIVFFLFSSTMAIGCINSNRSQQGTAGGGEAIGDPNRIGINPVSPANTIEPSPIPTRAAYGHIIYFSNINGQINLYVSSLNGSDQTLLTTTSSDNAFSVSPDGTHVAFVSIVDNNMDIYVLNMLSNLITRVTDSPEKDSAPTWSPDSQRLAFESFRDGNFEIYIANIDGSNLIRLTNDPAGDNNPVWSPTGDEIVFTSNRFGNTDLFLLSLNGTVDTLTTNPGPDNNPAWSPDGTRIAYQIFSSDVSQICLVDHVTKIQNCLTQTMDVYAAPVWSPDGLWLAVTSLKASSITLFNTQNGSTTQIYQQGIEPRGEPAWSPDGLRLVFSAQTSAGNTDLFIVYIQNNEFTRLTHTTAYDSKPIWIAE